MDPQIRVLVVDDDEPHAQAVAESLSRVGYDCTVAVGGREALRLIEEHDFDIVITDLVMEPVGGLEVLQKAKQELPDAEVVILTGHSTVQTAVRAMQAGAATYLTKPLDINELRAVADKASQSRRLARENIELHRQLQERFGFEGLVGNSPQMKAIIDKLRQIAPTTATALILGESGTGKELIAGALHTLSSRRDHPYVRINCAAIPETLLESELFGHEKGAFTGAIKSRPGRVEEADGGTIFLDEIGDMSRPLQAKLLRFLEDGSFVRVGGNQEQRVDVRLLAATNRDIAQAIRQNQFREDLYHRLNVIQLCPPPLRERGVDILLLAEHFLRQFGGAMGKLIKGICPGAQQKLLSHHWPGNVRELRNAIERAVILENSQEIQAASLPDFYLETRLRGGQAETPLATGGQSIDDIMSQFEREVIVNTLEQYRYNLSRTADHLKISRHALRYRMQRLNVPAGAETDDEPIAGKES
jgi:two-component system response regulator HydG